MRWHLSSIVVTLLLTSGPIPSGHGGDLKGAPTTPVEMGNAFVKAWRQFRRDLDVLAGAKVHPNVLDGWFLRMPDFLLRDAARLATDHEVIIAAASRLAEIGGKENRRFICAQKERFADEPLDAPLTMLLVQMGDPAFVKQTLERMKHAVGREQLAAAVVLAGGGDSRGLGFLRALVKSGKAHADVAAVALARYGKVSDEALIRKRASLSADGTLFSAALGEIGLKKYFPYHYRAFLVRNRVFETQMAVTGLYQTWLVLSERAVSGGATTSGAFLESLKETRRTPPAWAGDPDRFQRQLAALIDFWVALDERLKGDPSPIWPTDFGAAMQTIATGGDKKRQTEADISARAAASIAVAAALGGTLDYPRLAVPTPDLNIISPFGERAVDGNMATAWYFHRERPLIAVHPANRTIESLQLMLSCPDQTASAPLTAEVSGETPSGEKWRVTAALSEGAHYFQQVAIHKLSAGRVAIRITGATSGVPACLAELRAQLR